MKRPRIWLAGGLGAVALLTVWSERVGRAAEEASAVPTVDNPGPQGLKAAYLYLSARRGAGILEGPAPSLPGDARVLVTALPYVEPYSPAERASLATWVAAGGTLVVLGQHQWDLGGAVADLRPPAHALDVEGREVGVTELGQDVKSVIQAASEHTQLQQVLARTAAPDPVTASVRQVSVSLDRGFAAQPGPSLPLLVVGTTPVALAQRRGRGRILAFAGPDAFTNQRIDQADNLQLLANLGQLGRVYFDEHHHVAAGPGVWKSLGFARTPFAQALFLAALVVVASARRTGRVRPERRAATRSAGEYTSQLGKLYLRAGVTGAVCRAAYLELRSTLGIRLGVPASADDGAAARAIGLRRPPLADEYRALSALLQSDGHSAEAAAALVRRAVALKHAL